MNAASDPKSLPAASPLSPDTGQGTVPAAATGVLTVDLDAIVANWRKLEKTAVPAECAGVVKADAYGCGAAPVARALANAGCRTFFVATLDEAAAVRTAVPPPAAIYVLDAASATLRLLDERGNPAGAFTGFASVPLAMATPIGDAVRTDLAAAKGLGVDSLFIASGIHNGEVLVDGEIDAARLAELFAPAETPPAIAAMTQLRW